MNRLIGLSKVFYNTILDLIYPEEGICFICDNYDEDIKKGHICPSCMKKLIFINDHRCSLCGKPLELGYIPDKCPDCIKHPHYFTKAIAPLEYTGAIKDAIYAYKYGKKSYMYKAFGQLLVQALREYGIDDIDIIVPVPLHRRKYADRGFNQAKLLGDFISKEFKIPMNHRNLKRVRETEIQNKLHRTERLKNVKNAFIVKKPEDLKNKKVLLVDDILTTGSTADSCSKVLLKAGAREVIYG